MQSKLILKKKQFSIFLCDLGKYGTSSLEQYSKSPIFNTFVNWENPSLKLWINWEKLSPNLSFTVENNIDNLNKIRLFKLEKYYLKFKSSSKNWEKYFFHWEDFEFWTHWEFFVYHTILATLFWKDPEYLYQLFDVLPKHTTSKMKALQTQVYIQQWHHDEQGAKVM